MKNPDRKPLRITKKDKSFRTHFREYGIVLSNLAVAESNLVKAGKDSAIPLNESNVQELQPA